MRSGPVFLIVAAREGQNILCAALFSLLLVVTEAKDINTVCGCGRDMEPDMAPGKSPDSDVFIDLGSSTGYSGLLVPSRDSTFRHKPGSRWWLRLLTSVWTLMVLQVMDINTEPSC